MYAPIGAAVAAGTFSKSAPLVVGVFVTVGCVVVGSALGLGLGAGLNNDSENLTVIETTTNARITTSKYK